MTNSTCLKFATNLTFNTIVALRTQLYNVLTNDTSGHLCLDLSEVSQCDSAGLALLIEARKLCQQHDKQLEIKGISSETLSLAEFCGVRGILETL